jgi:hypothetical protein
MTRHQRCGRYGGVPPPDAWQYLTFLDLAVASVNTRNRDAEPVLHHMYGHWSPGVCSGSDFLWLKLETCAATCASAA